MTKTFKHSGCAGDCWFSLPTIRALGGGILYLDPSGGATDPYVLNSGISRTKFDAPYIASISKLLARVPFVTEVRLWNGEPIDYNLNKFRQHVGIHNLSDSHLFAFGQRSAERDTAWLEINDPIVHKEHPYIVARTVRYHGNYCWWAGMLKANLPKCAFVGLEQEHDIFEYTYGIEIPHIVTADALELARVIAGADKFIGNQSFAHAIAESMKKKLINEVFRPDPAAIFERPDALYV